MKKLLFILCCLCSTAAICQDIDFTFDNDMQGWTAYDLDGNGNTIVHGKQWYVDKNDGNKIKATDEGVLRYNISTGPDTGGAYVPNYDKEDNWLISPAIDIGNVTAFNIDLFWEDAWETRTNSIVFFASETPDVESFRPLTISQRIGDISKQTNSNFPAFQTSKTITIQKSKLESLGIKSSVIYIGIKRASNPSSVSKDFNIKQIYLSPNGGGEVSLSTNDVKAGKSLTKVMQNPVGSTLMLQLNPAMAAAKATVQVYSAAGQQVLNAKYAKELNVSALAPGMYIAKVADGTLTETVKFIKR